MFKFVTIYDMKHRGWSQTAPVLALLCLAGILSAKEVQKKTMNDPKPKQETAIFAGGCFWCMQPPFDKTPGVISTVVGYTGGRTQHPTYEQVCEGNSGHLESIQVTYDPSKIGYLQILDVFWRQIDPTDPDGQFCDKGESYKSAIFYSGDAQKKLALESKDKMEKSGRFGGKIVTDIRPASDFWPAEDYHQEYYKKNPIRYKFYRFNCGRDQRLEKFWGKSDH